MRYLNFDFLLLIFKNNLNNIIMKIIQSHQIVYRGQQISQLELTKLKNSVGKYISFNTYLSASINECSCFDIMLVEQYLFYLKLKLTLLQISKINEFVLYIFKIKVIFLKN